jgi:p-hydroxybenzoate 3-monooxygenase
MMARLSCGRGATPFFVDTKKYTGKRMMAYGQTAITEDRYAARDGAGGQIIDEAGSV